MPGSTASPTICPRCPPSPRRRRGARCSPARSPPRRGQAPGIPVCVGGADSVLGALGLGITEPGQVAYIAGTSNVILGLSDTAAADPAHRYLITPMPVLGGWGLEMDLLATGSAHGWLAGLLTGGRPGRARLRLAAGVDPEEAPSFLPYLLPGEQGARWDPDLAGTLTGLHLGHGPGHLARGLQTGIVAESRHRLAVLAASERRYGRGVPGLRRRCHRLHRSPPTWPTPPAARSTRPIRSASTARRSVPPWWRRPHADGAALTAVGTLTADGTALADCPGAAVRSPSRGASRPGGTGLACRHGGSLGGERPALQTVRPRRRGRIGRGAG